MKESQRRISQCIAEKFGKEVELRLEGENWIIIEVDRQVLRSLVSYLREEPMTFTLLTDITAVDNLGRHQDERFEVIYHLYSIKEGLRVRIKIKVPEKDSIPTITDLFHGANWLEREVFDMFGIEFKGHPHLKRILCHDEFKGHPLRKDYDLKKRQKLSRPPDLL